MSTLLKDVYGISNELLKSYVERSNIDNEFDDAFTLTDHHIVVFGETKVGKSHLRKKYVPVGEDVIVVDCTKDVALSDIYMQILYKAGIELTETMTKSFEEGAKLGAEVQAGWLEILKAKITGELTEKELETEVVRPPIPSTMSIRVSSELIKVGKRLVVLDDFHYLSLLDQSQLAFDLKMFYQNGIRFIILGTKISSGYFEKFNGELSQRIDYVDATKWSEEDLKRIVSKGDPELNIRISDDVVNYFIEASGTLVGIFQALLFNFCRASGVKRKLDQVLHLSDLDLARKCVTDYWEALSKTYFDKIRDIAGGGRRRKLQLYYYLMVIALNSDVQTLKRGIPFANLFDHLQKIHPLQGGLNQGNLTSVLNHIDDLQSDKQVFPKVFTYFDKRLYVVDSLFYFIIKHFVRDSLDDILPPGDYKIKDLKEDEDE